MGTITCPPERTIESLGVDGDLILAIVTSRATQAQPPSQSIRHTPSALLSTLTPTLTPVLSAVAQSQEILTKFKANAEYVNRVNTEKALDWKEREKNWNEEVHKLWREKEEWEKEKEERKKVLLDVSKSLESVREKIVSLENAGQTDLSGTRLELEGVVTVMSEVITGLGAGLKQ